MLLINLENRNLQKAHNSDTKICLEALFFSSFGRKKSYRASGNPGLKPRNNQVRLRFSTTGELGSERKVFLCLPVCCQLPVTSGQGRAGFAACGPSPEQTLTQSTHLIDRGSQRVSNLVMFNSRALLHNHSESQESGAVSLCG